MPPTSAEIEIIFADGRLRLGTMTAETSADMRMLPGLAEIQGRKLSSSIGGAR